MDWTTLLTIVIVIIFAALVAYFYRLDYKRNVTKYTTTLVFTKYNKQLDKLIKLFNEEKYTALFNDCKMNIVAREKHNEDMIYDNIRVIDAIEDNLELMKSIKREFSHRGEVQGRVRLLKDHLDIVDLSEYAVKPVHAKHKAIMNFADKLNEVTLDDKYKVVLSATPCYKFGDILMFLGNKIMKVDLENIFSAEYIDYSEINIKIWKSEEGYIDFDGTYDLSKTLHKFPEGADESDPNTKEQVFAKVYVLSLTRNEMTYDISTTEVLTESQEKFDKLCEKFG